MAIDSRPIIQTSSLEYICKNIGDTNTGMTGGEIEKILRDSGIEDSDKGVTKWKRLYNAFANYQNNAKSSSKIIIFLCHAMHPSRYLGKTEIFHSRLTELNKQLSFIGIELTGTGKFRKVDAAKTLTEAEQRASNFKQKLIARNVHPDIFKFCDPELIAENYFHSVFEGVKSIGERLRFMSNVHADGNPLVDVAFSTSNPLIKINLLIDDNHRSEHLGLANSIKGLFGLIRNPTAHKPKIVFLIDESEALDVMTIISYIHKRLDKAL